MHDRCSLCGVNELLPTAACCGVRGILQSYRTYFRDITLLLLALSKQKLSLLEVGGVKQGLNFYCAEIAPFWIA